MHLCQLLYTVFPGGEFEDVSIDNIEDYIELLTDFCCRTGEEVVLNVNIQN